MVLQRWRARREIASRSAPSSIEDHAAPALIAAVERLKAPLDAHESRGDPHWHARWEGRLQLVGLDATRRSVTDVRQRLVRLHHELCLAHMPRTARRVLAVVLVAPGADEGLVGWQSRLDDDRGEVGRAAWRAARRRIAVLALDARGGHLLRGGDREVARAVDAWTAGRPAGGEASAAR